MVTDITLHVLKVDQPLGAFYIGAIDSQKVIEISTAEVRNFLDDDAESLEGIQRHLSPKRRKEISKYVNFEFATFPTSIILSVDERCVTVKESKSVSGFFEMKIHSYTNKETGEQIDISESAFILDGQHRLAGLRAYNGNNSFEVNVSIFIGLSKPDQAEIFSKVNLTQTRVNKSLVYDLYAYQKKPSPTKMAHQLTIALDKDPNGPLSKKIKRLGITTPGRSKERLSQATVVRGILKHMPSRIDEERNKGILGFNRKPEPDDNWKRRIFIPFYRNEDRDSLLEILTNFFSAVEEKWPDAWEDPDQEYMLCSTNGFNALIRFLKPSFIDLCKEIPRVVTKEEFASIFEDINLPESRLLTADTEYGSSGESWLFNNLMKLSGL